MKWLVYIVAGLAALFVLLVGLLVLGGGFTHTGESHYADLAWSADGKRFVYAHFDSTDDECRSTIVVQDTDGKTELTDHGEHPDWSPDGTRLVFMLIDYEGLGVERGSIAVMDGDGSHVRRLLMRSKVDSVIACETGALNDPVWSTDGERIAFSDGSGLFTVHSDGSRLQRITDNAKDSEPEWTPDSKHLLFRNGAQIKIIDSDGGGRRTLVPSTPDFPFEWLPPTKEVEEIAFALSPNGKEIAYGPFLIALRGGEYRQLPIPAWDCTDCVGGPAWSPDGKQIAFLRGDGEIFAVDVPTVAPTFKYRYALSTGGQPNLGEDEIAAGYGVDVYLSSPDLPEGEQLILTYELCAALQEGERCHPVSRATLNAGERIVETWRMGRGEKLRGSLRLRARVQGRIVANHTLRVVKPPYTG